MGPSRVRFDSPLQSFLLMTAVVMLFGAARTARAQWKVDGSPLGDRTDMTVFGGDGRGGLFGWAGYPGLDAQYFLTAEGDTVAGWPTTGISLVPGNLAWRDHGSFEPLAGVPDGEGGSYVLVAEQWPNIYGVGFLVSQQLFVHRRTSSGSVARGWDVQGVQLETSSLDHRFEWHHPAQMVADGERGVLVCWMDEQRPYSRVVVQGVTAAGTRRWGDDGVFAQRLPDACTVPTLVADGHGGALVFWGRRDSSMAMHIQGRHILASGELGWGADGRTLSTQSFDRMAESIPSDGGWAWAYYSPAIAVTPDGAGGAMLFWAASEGTDLNIYATRVGADGRAAWPRDLVVCSASGEQAEVVSTPRGRGAIVAWRDARKGDDIGFFAQAVSREGRMQWARDGAVVCDDTGQREMLCIQTDRLNGAYFAWLDFGRNYQLFAQRLTQAGDVGRGWEERGSLISHTARPWGLPWDQHYRTIQLVEGDRGNAIAGWTANPGGTLAMLLTRRGPASTIIRDVGAARPMTNVSTPAPEAAGPVFALRGVSPNPIAAGSVLKFALPEATSATLEMIDVTGRRVWTREVGNLGAGEHTISLAAAGRLPRGVYFVRLSQGIRVATTRVVTLK